MDTDAFPATIATVAKSPTNYLDAMSRNGDGSPDGDLVVSLTNMGEDVMAKIVEQTSKLCNQRARPQPHDLAEMMQLCSQAMHVCSRILGEIPPAADGAGALPTKRKMASAAGDIGSISVIDEQMEPLNFRDIPDPDLDMDLWDEFSFSDSQCFNGWSVVVDSCASVAQDQAGTGASSVKNDPSSGKNQSRDKKQGKGRKQDQDGPAPSSVQNNSSSSKNQSRDGKQDKGRKLAKASYLNKLVVHTNPKMPLGEYLQKADGKPVCLCGRGGHAHHHAGNKAYLDLIKSRLPDYRSRSRKGKEKFTNALVRKFQEDGWRFLRVNGEDEWEEIDRDAIRSKVSQNFPDGPTPSPEEGGLRGAKRQRSDAHVGGGEVSQPTPLIV